jgi:hypothetical protein
MKRFINAVVAAALFALLPPIIASADTLALATVECGDGSPLTAAVDLDTLTQIQESIQGMLASPSGVSCTLSQPTLADPLSTGSNPGSFVVGGGRYDRAECPINFSLSGHVDKTGAHGTQTATMNDSVPGCPGQGHIKANVTCVAIAGNVAEIRGVIMEQTGSLGPGFFPPGSTVLVTDVVDNGHPSSGVPDQIQQSVDFTGTEDSCAATVTSPIFTVDNGNITVHDK